MKIKRILSSALVAVMLFTMSVALMPIEADAAHSPSVNKNEQYTVEYIKEEIVKKSYDYSYESAEEMLEAELAAGYLDSVKSKSGKYSIYVNRYTGTLYYKNNATGEVLTSNPYDLSNVSSETTKAQLISQVSVSFAPLSSTTSVIPYYSSTWAAEYGQISVYPIANGLRVNYTLGDTSTRFHLPGKLVVEDFENHIMRPLFKYFEELLEEHCRAQFPDAVFDYFAADTYNNNPIREEANGNALSINVMRMYLNDMRALYSQIYDDTDSEYKLLNAFNSNINLMSLKYTVKKNPVRDENGRVTGEILYTYDFGDNKISSKRQVANLIKNYCPDYTMQQIVADETRAGHVTVVEQKPAFRLSLEYTFNEDETLSVRLPANSITFDETEYALFDVSVLN